MLGNSSAACGRPVAGEPAFPCEFRLRHREEPNAPLITCHLEIDEWRGRLEIEEEWIQSESEADGKPFRCLEVRNGCGKVMG